MTSLLFKNLIDQIADTIRPPLANNYLEIEEDAGDLSKVDDEGGEDYTVGFTIPFADDSVTVLIFQTRQDERVDRVFKEQQGV